MYISVTKMDISGAFRVKSDRVLAHVSKLVKNAQICLLLECNNTYFHGLYCTCVFATRIFA